MRWNDREEGWNGVGTKDPRPPTATVPEPKPAASGTHCNGTDAVQDTSSKVVLRIFIWVVPVADCERSCFANQESRFPVPKPTRQVATASLHRIPSLLEVERALLPYGKVECTCRQDQHGKIAAIHGAQWLDRMVHGETRAGHKQKGVALPS